ncbi:MAG: hypothetical protein MRECE_4c026 [Mycoplasmataceae bacterium CE_OT135]|nr:MAG: hypothetical protein MRECE_4c026 [Mycoplasmataceae bacterium CE_OT135]
MTKCDICGKKFSGSILRYNNTTYCPDCRQQAEAQGNAPWNKFLKPGGLHLGWWMGIGVLLLVGLGVFIYWLVKRKK